MPEELLPVGCLWDWAEETDFLLCEWDVDHLPTLYQQDNIIFEYNQGNQTWSKVSCTIFAAMWMLSDLMNYQFSLDEIKEVDELSYSAGRIRGQWWYVKDAVKLVAKWWNEKHSDKVAYYRVYKYDNSVIDDLLDKNYTIDTNFCPTVDYSRDYRPDARLDWYEFWTKTNWHSVDIISYKGKRSVKDSYKGRKTQDGKKDCNIYELVNPLSKITNFGMYWFVYTKVSEDNYERLKELNEFKTILLLAIENNSKMWHLTNDDKYKDLLHLTNEANRKKLADINEQLKLLS